MPAGAADPSRDLKTDPHLAAVPVREGHKVVGGVVLYRKPRGPAAERAADTRRNAAPFTG